MYGSQAWHTNAFIRRMNNKFLSIWLPILKMKEATSGDFISYQTCQYYLEVCEEKEAIYAILMMTEYFF